MKEIKAYRTHFAQRLFIQSGLYIGLIFFLILELLILFKRNISTELFILLQIVLIISIVTFFMICFNKAKIYIQAIKFNEDHLILSIARFDEELPPKKISYDSLAIDFDRNLVEKYPKHTLEFKLKNQKAVLGHLASIKQYELGFWNKENLQKVYDLIISKRKG
ncbi:MAG: hypothetical protein HWE15_14345 [Algoriphagus sp.]|uniref:hypothetical protein n=1 Tax=Algoriphagus sp. TaxID=1872435 RepID=UPI00184384E8|nr:hypothetical protein [Algoriphagus sp.]NVJ87486.1 hypothetical protein [Algoriphagus sp.]